MLFQRQGPQFWRASTLQVVKETPTPATVLSSWGSWLLCPKSMSSRHLCLFVSLKELVRSRRCVAWDPGVALPGNNPNSHSGSHRFAQFGSDGCDVRRGGDYNGLQRKTCLTTLWWRRSSDWHVHLRSSRRGRFSSVSWWPSFEIRTYSACTSRLRSQDSTLLSFGGFTLWLRVTGWSSKW